MTLPPSLSVYISAALFVLGAYAAALYVGLIVWTFRDIRARSRDMLAQIMAVLLVALFTLPGLVVYLLLRPHDTLTEEYERNLAEEAILQDLAERHVCPSCQRRVESDYIICPYCHEQLRFRCVGCGRLLQPIWDVCPYCGLYREQQPEESLQAAVPVAREARTGEEKMTAEPLASSVAPEGEPSQTIRIPALDMTAEDVPHSQTPSGGSKAAQALKTLRSLWERPAQGSSDEQKETPGYSDIEEL